MWIPGVTRVVHFTRKDLEKFARDREIALENYTLSEIEIDYEDRDSFILTFNRDRTEQEREIYIKQTNISMISQFMERLKQSPEFEVELEKRLLEHHQTKENISNNEKELYLRLKKKYEI